MLKPEERALLLAHCTGHPVAVCPRCSEQVTFERISADVISGRRDFCPVCRGDLAAALRQHLAECTRRRAPGHDPPAWSPPMVDHRPPHGTTGGVDVSVMAVVHGDAASPGD